MAILVMSLVSLLLIIFGRGNYVLSDTSYIQFSANTTTLSARVAFVQDNNSNETMQRLLSHGNPIDFKVCEKYKKGDFLPETHPQVVEMKSPPLLLSHGGSGNTWVRLLIERMTGFYTGTIRLDDQDVLKSIFPGEGFCGLRLVAVKGHPPSFELRPNGLVIQGNYFKDSILNCKKGKVKFFDRVIFIVRNPYDAIWAEVQRTAPDDIIDSYLSYDNGSDAESMKNNHVKTLSLSTVQEKKYWLTEAKRLAGVYKDSWNQLIYPVKQLLSPLDFYVLRYEDLLDLEKSRKALKNMLIFMGYNDAYTEERVNCAFLLSNRKEIKRNNHINSTIAYYINKNLVCSMWRDLNEYANNFSYKAFQNRKCHYYK